ncbi:glutathione reductase chloroplastic [Prunus yedoensis var. nudiflora]|uniref:Glutathione reductase chloroplastic n=1 Tax=Prunus yedoensis var. nudiflora TaxID=2094558 RepID=A0A314XZ50_PRUYE|nr:glutathione reductase chloroplastic [Prunus yedoensis var. nudiflora]
MSDNALFTTIGNSYTCEVPEELHHGHLSLYPKAHLLLFLPNTPKPALVQKPPNPSLCAQNPNLTLPPPPYLYLSPPAPQPPPRPLRSRRFRKWADSGRHYDYDLFTIGAGSGGVRASRFAANFGASVAVCELPFATISSDTAGGVGGTCVLRGCVPKKLLVYASKFAHEFEESNGFGWRYETEPKHDWSTLMANKNAELQRLTGIYKNVLKNAGVALIEGRGKIVDPHTVDVDGKLYSARHILVSVGGRPFIPEIPGIEYAIDSDAALDLPSKPKKIAIVGGGYIAVEFAGIFNDNKGTLEGFSHIMFATGRRPNTKNLGLEEVGVKLSKTGAIESEPDSSCFDGGGALAKTLFLNEPTKPDYRAVPSAVFSQPPIGQVGLTEEQAIEQYGDVDIYTSNFRPLKATLSGLPDRVFMKLLVCAKTNKVLGLHMCGEDSAEIVQGFAVVVKAGLTKADLDATIGIHPTAAEEFVTMRTPTRKIRKNPPSQGKTDSDVKAPLVFDCGAGNQASDLEELRFCRAWMVQVSYRASVELEQKQVVKSPFIIIR